MLLGDELFGHVAVEPLAGLLEVHPVGKKGSQNKKKPHSIEKHQHDRGELSVDGA
jgi:hypothetical protein